MEFEQILPGLPNKVCVNGIASGTKIDLKIILVPHWEMIAQLPGLSMLTLQLTTGILLEISTWMSLICPKLFLKHSD